MRLTEQPEELKARSQWDQLRRTIEACGTTVQIVEPDRHCMYKYIFHDYRFLSCGASNKYFN